MGCNETHDALQSFMQRGNLSSGRPGSAAQAGSGAAAMDVDGAFLQILDTCT
jgi:hypothetical protein